MKETKQDLIIGTDVVGQPIYITKYVLEGSAPGKTMYIQGGVHGGEITLHLIRDIYDYAKAHLKCGKIIFIPYANPLAWAQKAYTYTVGKFNDKTGEDFNRTFGKTTAGNTSVQIANAILKECQNIDFAIDFHTAHVCFPHTISFEEDDMKFVKMANIKYNRLCYNSSEYKSTLNYQLSLRGVKNFTLECGPHDDINPQYQQQIVDGVLNVMKNLGFFEYTAKMPKEKLLAFSQSTSYFAECGGIVDFKFNLGDSFKKGDVLYTIKPANLQEDEHKIIAEFDGVIFRFTKTHIFNAFDEVMRVFKNEDLTEIK